MAQKVAMYKMPDQMRSLGLLVEGSATGTRTKHLARPNTRSLGSKMLHPCVGYQMWRGNTLRYRYSNAQQANYGEGEAEKMYHQYYRHAKDPVDGNKANDPDYLDVKVGKLVRKPLPVPQVPKDSVPKWHFKSWQTKLYGYDVWRRELEYPEHVPEHLGAKRPLAVLAPFTAYRGMHLLNMEKISITVSPFLFGYGHTVQKAATDFYRACVANSSLFPQDKVFLFYSLDLITPQIDVTWVDGSVFRVPVVEGQTGTDLIQCVMERAWLMGDVVDAQGKELAPPVHDDFRWEEVVDLRAKKKKVSDKPISK